MSMIEALERRLCLSLQFGGVDPSVPAAIGVSQNYMEQMVKAAIGSWQEIVHPSFDRFVYVDLMTSQEQSNYPNSNGLTPSASDGDDGGEDWHIHLRPAPVGGSHQWYG